MDDNQERMLTELYSVFMQVPPGSSDLDRPFIEDLRVVVAAYKRGSWLARILVWLIPTIALLLASADAIASRIMEVSR